MASYGNLSEMSAQSANDADERSAADITNAKEAVLESDHLAFVAAVVSGDIAASPVAVATGDVDDEVREAALSVARAALSGDAANGKASQILASLAKMVEDKVVATEASTAMRSEDHRRGALVALYGHCAATSLPSGDADRSAALELILKSLKSLGDHGCFVAAPAVAPLAADLGAAATARIEKLMADATTSAAENERRAGAAGVAGLCNGMGGSSISQVRSRPSHRSGARGEEGRRRQGRRMRAVHPHVPHRRQGVRTLRRPPRVTGVRPAR